MKCRYDFHFFIRGAQFQKCIFQGFRRRFAKNCRPLLGVKLVRGIFEIFGIFTALAALSLCSLTIPFDEPFWRSDKEWVFNLFIFCASLLAQYQCKVPQPTWYMDTDRHVD